MPSLASYADLQTAINDYTERSYSQARRDIFIGNAEAKFNRRLASSWRGMDSTTLTTDANGEATLPSGFIGLRSVVQDLVGSAPLTQVSWDALLASNPWELSDSARLFAIKGTSFKVAPLTTDDFVLVFDSKLTPLSNAATSNWLLTLAPDIYLNACLAEETIFTRDFGLAQGMWQQALADLDAVVSQDQVAQFGNVEMRPAMVMP